MTLTPILAQLAQTTTLTEVAYSLLVAPVQILVMIPTKPLIVVVHPRYVIRVV